VTNKFVAIINSLKCQKLRKFNYMKWNFLYQISAASRTPDWGPTAPRSPFSPSSVLNWICWNPLHPEQNSWLRHWMDVQLCCNIYIVKCNWLVQCYMCSTWMSKYWNWDWSNYCEGESCSRKSTIVHSSCWKINTFNLLLHWIIVVLYRWQSNTVNFDVGRKSYFVVWSHY